MATTETTVTPSTESNQPTAPREGLGWLISPVIGLAILGAIAFIPSLGGATQTNNWTIILMYVVLAQSWNFIGGFTGYSAFGNAAFFGIGAYAVAQVFYLQPQYVSSTDPHRPQQLLIGLLIGVAIAILFAVIVGLPTLRLKGHYFAIATLGTTLAVSEIVVQRDIGGSGGLASNVPIYLLNMKPLFFYGFLILALLCLLITVWLTRSKFGYALVAIRENEQAAESLGIATTWYKVGAYALSAVPTALAGGLYAYYSGGFEPNNVFGPNITVTMVLMAFLGGSGTVLGPILGAIAFQYATIQFSLQSTTAFTLFGYHVGPTTLLGLLIIVVTLLIPQGIIRFVQEFVRKPAPGAVRTNQFVEGVRRVRKFIAANGI